MRKTVKAKYRVVPDADESESVCFSRSMMDAIIRKLRAADALKDAARGLVSSSTPELYDEYYSATKKAIAAYDEA